MWRWRTASVEALEAARRSNHLRSASERTRQIADELTVEHRHLVLVHHNPPSYHCCERANSAAKYKHLINLGLGPIIRPERICL